MSRPDIIAVELDQKGLTRLRILDCIRVAKQISRLDIAHRLHISPATVTSVSADLLASGLIVEVEAEPNKSAAKRGRPRVMLKLNGEAFVVAGLKVARHAISVILMDFEGTERGRFEAPLADPCLPPDRLVAIIQDAVEQACCNAGLAVSALSGVAIGLPGQIDAGMGYVHWSSALTERNVDLGARLTRRLPCPCFLENDANLVAKAEQLFGEARDLSDFLVVTIEYGVGLGIVLDGAVYRGTRGCGAEFGHMKVQLDGAPCQCGQSGCLEAYVSDYALLREAREPLDNITDLLRMAAAGQGLAQPVLDRAGQMFAVGLANLINLFDPERIILAGAQFAFDHLRSEAVMARVARSVVNGDAALPDIQVHSWSDVMWAKGAAGYAIEQVSVLKVRDVDSNAA
ncbi:MAG: ROK family protein [Arenibacterium sp.]